MNNYKEYVLVTDWERVASDDFYLSDKWTAGSMKEARMLAKESKLYVAYIVPAVSYAIYTQMDANQVFIDNEMNIVLECETAVINNDHVKRVEYEN